MFIKRIREYYCCKKDGKGKYTRSAAMVFCIYMSFYYVHFQSKGII